MSTYYAHLLQPGHDNDPSNSQQAKCSTLENNKIKTRQLYKSS